MQALGNMSDLAETYLQFSHPKGSGYHAVLPHRDSIIQNEIQLARRQVQYIADIRKGLPTCHHVLCLSCICGKLCGVLQTYRYRRSMCLH